MVGGGGKEAVWVSEHFALCRVRSTLARKSGWEGVPAVLSSLQGRGAGEEPAQGCAWTDSCLRGLPHNDAHP